MIDRKYTVDTWSNKDLIKLNVPFREVPFNVFRDLCRLSYMSWEGDGTTGSEPMFVIISGRLNEAEKVLSGAMFVKNIAKQ